MTLSKLLVVSQAFLALGLAGCVESRQHLADDFGAVVNQNQVAQIADPDAAYPKEVISDGPRVGLAMERYQTGKTIKPEVTASTIGIVSQGGIGAEMGASK